MLVFLWAPIAPLAVTSRLAYTNADAETSYVTQEAPNPPAAVGSTPAARDPERVRLAEQLLEQCWDLVADTFLSRAADIFNEVATAAVRSGDEVQVRCARMLSIQGKALGQALRGALHTAYEGGVAAFLGKESAPSWHQSVLSLVEIDASDLSSQVDQAINRLRHLVEEASAGPTLRLQTLAGERALHEADSPLRPGVFLEAIAESLSSVISAPSDVATIVRHVPVAIEPPLSATYAAINRFLDSKGIAPASAVRAAPVQRNIGPATIRAEVPASLAALSSNAEPGVTSSNAAGLAPRRSGAKASSSGRAGHGRVGAAAGANAGVAAGTARDEQLLVEYARLQALAGVNASSLVDTANSASRSAAMGQEASVVPPSSQLVDAMIASQRQDAQHMSANEQKREPGQEPIGTREHSRRLIALTTHPVHKLTIQLVARLFTRMERDRLVPGPVRALLFYLRFPALEVALADPSIFVRSDHPARRLIDAIGSASIGWSADGTVNVIANKRFLQQVRTAVQFVLHSPGEAASAFAQASAQFSAFLTSDSMPEDDTLAAARAALREAEQREIRTIDVAAFLREVLEGAQLDDYLRNFLLRVWARVLVEAAAREAQEPGLVRRLLNAIPDLAWSVQPLGNPMDRKRLIDTIPAVLGSLRDGLRLIDWPAKKNQALLDHLMRAHSHVFKATEAPAAGAFSVSTVRIRLDGFRIEPASGSPRGERFDVLEEAVHHVLAQGGSGVLHQWIEADNAPPLTAYDAAQAEQLVAQWHEKMWFDLRVDETLARVRLECFTPSRALALFSSARGDSLYSLSHASLITYLRCSRITPAEPMPLVLRALRTVLADLERSSKAAIDGDSAGT